AGSTGTTTLTAQDVYVYLMTAVSAETYTLSLHDALPICTGVITGLSGGNKLTGAGDFTAGVANLTTLGLTYTGPSGTGTFTATATGASGTSGSVTVTEIGRASGRERGEEAEGGATEERENDTGNDRCVTARAGSSG